MGALDRMDGDRVREIRTSTNTSRAHELCFRLNFKKSAGNEKEKGSGLELRSQLSPQTKSEQLQTDPD